MIPQCCCANYQCPLLQVVCKQTTRLSPLKRVPAQSCGPVLDNGVDGGRDALEAPPPHFEGAQPMPSHSIPDDQCQAQ